MKKKLKVKIPDSALKDIPEDDRQGVVEEIKTLFDKKDPQTIGEPVEQLPAGAKHCPRCGEVLEKGPTFSIPDGEVVQIFDCVKCDKAFMGEPLN